jgi:gluconate 2-dehydrogenase gamma chain
MPTWPGNIACWQMRRPMRRRTFLAAGIAGSAVACRGRGSSWQFFTVEEARTVEAVCAQIIPEDQDAGAITAGVVHFLDKQLCGFYKPLQRTYRTGIAGINRRSVESGGTGFAELSSASQIELLKGIEKDSNLKAFFLLLVEHSMQGFYGDPRHGGNRDRVSWKMLGVPYPPVRGRLRYDFTDPAKGEKLWL